MRVKTGAALLSAFIAMAASAPASAALLNFTLTGAATAVWSIDSNPSPNAIGPGSFVVTDVPGNYSAIPGNGPINYLADITFYTTTFGGGLTVDNFYDDITLVDATGLQLFTGTTAVPQFTLGTYTLTDVDNPARLYVLNISTAAPAVPESSTWALMIGGFGLTGGVLRSRKTKVAFNAA